MEGQGETGTEKETAKIGSPNKTVFANGLP